MRKILAVARKELRQIARDRRTLAILLFFPLFLLLLYGYALNFDIRHIALAVDDRDRTPASRALISAFVNSGYFDLAASLRGSGPSVERLMDTGEVRAALVIPEGTAERLARGAAAPVQVLIDGANANTATIVMGYAVGIIRGVSPQLQAMAGVRPPAPPIATEPRVWYNPELRSAFFLVPGLIAYIAMITAVVSTALSIVREKERGTVEQIRMAPLGTLAYVLGKTLPYLAISMIAGLLIIGASMVLFDLPMRGSWLLLTVSLSLFLVGALGTGLFVSTVADSQQLAFQLALLVAFLPTLMLSDFIFPIASMPPALQAITYAVPARYFLVALRGILLKDVGLAILWPQLAAMAAYAAILLGVSAVRLAREA